jgi:hypothetical protein
LQYLKLAVLASTIKTQSLSAFSGKVLMMGAVATPLWPPLQLRLGSGPVVVFHRPPIRVSITNFNWMQPVADRSSAERELTLRMHVTRDDSKLGIGKRTWMLAG